MRRKGPPKWLQRLTSVVDTPETAAAIEQKVDELWAEDLPGREKKQAAIKAIARELAKAIDFTKIAPPFGFLLEAIDFQLFRLLLGLPVQLAYRAKKRRETKPARKAARKKKAAPSPAEEPAPPSGGDR